MLFLYFIPSILAFMWAITDRASSYLMWWSNMCLKKLWSLQRMNSFFDLPIYGCFYVNAILFLENKSFDPGTYFILFEIFFIWETILKIHLFLRFKLVSARLYIYIYYIQSIRFIFWRKEQMRQVLYFVVMDRNILFMLFTPNPLFRTPMYVGFILINMLQQYLSA